MPITSHDYTFMADKISLIAELWLLPTAEAGLSTGSMMIINSRKLAVSQDRIDVEPLWPHAQNLTRQL